MLVVYLLSTYFFLITRLVFGDLVSQLVFSNLLAEKQAIFLITPFLSHQLLKNCLFTLSSLIILLLD